MRKHGKRFRNLVSAFDRERLYDPLEATQIVKRNANAKFNETVEIHIKLGVDPKKSDQNVRGTVNLPHGTGRTVRVIAFAKGDAAKAAEAAGADALVVSNTILGLKIDTNSFKPAIGNKFGGLSGPGIKPIIVRMVYQCSKAVKIPVIGCGGIVKVEDVVEYMLAGASAVMVGYLTFRNPSGLIALIDGLDAWCARRGFARVADLTGAMIDNPPMETFAAAAAPIG